MTSINTTDLFSQLQKKSSYMPEQLLGIRNSASTKLQDLAIKKVFETQQSENNKILTHLEKRKAQVAEYGATTKHVQDTTTVLNKADKGLEETEAKLTRMKEIAEKVQGGKLSEKEQKELEEEFDKHKEDITKIGEETNYNKHKLLDGSLELVTQTKQHGGKNQSVKIEDMRAEALGIADLSLSSMKDAITSVAKLDQALTTVSKQRSAIGKEVDELTDIPEKMKSKFLKENEESFFTRLKNSEEAAKASANIKEQMLARKEEMHKRILSMFLVNPSDVLKLLS